MRKKEMNKITMTLNVDHLIKEALQEDISSEDVTTNAVMHEAVTGEVDLICKQDGVIAGLQVFQRVFELLDKDTKVEFFCKDGDEVKVPINFSDNPGLVGMIFWFEYDSNALELVPDECGVGADAADYITFQGN